MRSSVRFVFVVTVFFSCGGQMASSSRNSFVRVEDGDSIFAGPVDTSDAATLDAMQRSSAAAASVDTIIVRPDSIVLRVGQSVRLNDVINIEAFDSSGRPVAQFAPMLGVSDRSIAEYGIDGLVANGVGRTRLSIAPLSIDPSLPVRASAVYVTVIVKP